MLNVPVSDYLLVIAHSAHITRPAYQHCAEAGSWSRSGSPWERRIRSGSPCETHLVRGGEQEEQLVAGHTVSGQWSVVTRDMMKFRRSRSSGSYSVTRPGPPSGEEDQGDI